VLNKLNKFKSVDELGPIEGRIVLKNPKFKGQTESGLYVPDGTGEAPQLKEVVAVAEFFRDASGMEQDIPIEVGDYVMVGRYAGGTPFEIDGEEFVVVNYPQDVLILKLNTIQ
jgi:co-chaperonin GroES (HSP10)